MRKPCEACRQAAAALRHLAKDAASITKNSVRSGTFLSPSTAKERLEVCRACPELDQHSRCKACGCFVRAKALFKESTCPKARW